MNVTSDVRDMMASVNRAGEDVITNGPLATIGESYRVGDERRAALLILADAVEDSGNDLLASRLRMVAESGVWPRLSNERSTPLWSWCATDVNDCDYIVPMACIMAMSAAFVSGRIQGTYYHLSAVEALLSLAIALCDVPRAEALAALQPDKATDS